MSKIGILGAGGWAIALSVVLTDNGHDVTMWSALESEIADIETNHERKSVLPGVTVPQQLKLTRELSALSECDMIISSTASKFVRETAHKLRGAIRSDAIIVSVSKGLEPVTNLRLSQVISEETDNPVAVLSGPSHAEEVALRVPTALVAAAADEKTAKAVSQTFSNENMRVYLSEDMAGVELGAAIKNVIAVAAGVLDGAGLGDNTKAALMTRGIVEMARLGEAVGAKTTTFGGLSGIGDLIVTCMSMHSRNHCAGILIGQGVSVDDAVKQIGMTVEGVLAARVVHDLAKQKNIEMPIVESVYNVLYEGKPVREQISALMQRDIKSEYETKWF